MTCELCCINKTDLFTSLQDAMTMSRSCDEAACPKFQPNIFDPSRCHDCLHQRHLHSGTGGSREAAPQQKSTAQPKNEAKTVTDDGVGRGKGLVLTPSPSQTEEQDTSSKVRNKRMEGVEVGMPAE